jgi:hypothetical protein
MNLPAKAAAGIVAHVRVQNPPSNTNPNLTGKP